MAAQPEKETTTEALTRMMEELNEQEEASKTRAESVTINHPNNRGIVVGTHKGDMTW